ncbi:MAG: flagellar basal body L-ring protein FlgH, partial [Acidobacteria bacterium]|nr:flagellar basal body L-ring protein FlgH [Acidobacteriota bacterium]
MGILSRSAIQLGTLSLLACFTAGCGPKAARVTAAGSLDQFIAEAKREVPEDRNDGSLWVSHGRHSNLYRDFKAREVNDIVTIRVYETTRALASADAASSRKSQMEAGIPNLLGLENAIKELPNAVKASSDSSFEGEGTTARNTSVSTTVTARVTEVLPNGYLVVTGVK